jgi:hypothetical protein
LQQQDLDGCACQIAFGMFRLQLRYDGLGDFEVAFLGDGQLRLD